MTEAHERSIQSAVKKRVPVINGIPYYPARSCEPEQDRSAEQLFVVPGEWHLSRGHLELDKKIRPAMISYSQVMTLARIKHIRVTWVEEMLWA